MDTVKNDNALTLAAYQSKAREYINNTPPNSEDFCKWFDGILELIPKHGKVFEIGSGPGSDATYIASKGFTVTCSDAVPEFLEIIRNKGLTANSLDILKEDIPGSYDFIFANAVLPHFTADELGLVLDKVRRALSSQGVFALTLKKGDGAVWTTVKLDKPRYFHFWQPEVFTSFAEHHGFVKIHISSSHNSHSGDDWMLVTMRLKRKTQVAII
jgi:SAM-dependent methyltransferase